MEPLDSIYYTVARMANIQHQLLVGTWSNWNSYPLQVDLQTGPTTVEK